MSQYTGKLVRLAAMDNEEYSKLTVRWMNDAEYNRMIDSDPAIPLGVHQLRTAQEGRDENVSFIINTIPDDKAIGFTVLMLGGNLRLNRDAFVGIGIGDADYRGKGYGREALNLTLAYAFHELQLHRVSLGVFDYNARAIRAYEKLGFVMEGTERECVRRDGEWHNAHVMGILRREWLAKN